MGVLEQLSKPPKHKHVFNPSEEDIEKLAKEFEESEITPEAKAQFQREESKNNFLIPHLVEVTGRK